MKECPTLRGIWFCAAVTGVMFIYVIEGMANQSESFLDADALLAGWESTYGNVKTMRVSYSYRLVDYKPPSNNPEEPAPISYLHVERVEQGKQYHIRCSMAEDGFERSESLMEHAFDGKITREYWGGTKHGTIDMGMVGRATESTNHFKDFMLSEPVLVRGDLAEEYPDGVPRLVLYFRTLKSSAVVRPNLESIGGQSCHVIELSNIEGSPGTTKHILWMAHDKGMCLMRYQEYSHGKMNMEIEVERITRADIDGTDIWYPVKVRRTDEGAWGIITDELTVKEFVPNVKVDENTFRFAFPAGTWVVDRVAGLSYTIAGVDADGQASRVGELADLDKEHLVAGKPTQAVSNIGKTSSEDRIPPATATTDDQNKGKESRIPVESGTGKDKTLGVETVSILGVVALAGLGVLLWHKRSAKT